MTTDHACCVRSGWSTTRHFVIAPSIIVCCCRRSICWCLFLLLSVCFCPQWSVVTHCASHLQFFFWCRVWALVAFLHYPLWEVGIRVLNRGTWGYRYGHLFVVVITLLHCPQWSSGITMNSKLAATSTTSQWWSPLVNAYEVKQAWCLQCKSCVIHTWALQRWGAIQMSNGIPLHVLWTDHTAFSFHLSFIGLPNSSEFRENLQFE